MNVPSKFLKSGKVVGFGLLYVSAFVAFAYVSFPYERLKVYAVNRYNASHTGGGEGRLEIDELTWSWRFPGLVANGVRLVTASGSDEKPGTPVSVVEASEVYATTSIFGLMVGGRSASFGATGLGGEVEGSVDESDEVLTVELELDQIDPGLFPQVGDAIGLPVEGRLSGTVELSMPPGKINLAEGKIDLHVDDMTVGDGKAKIKNLIALPALRIGTFKLQADIANGRVKIKEFAASGEDLELSVTGGIRLRTRLASSVSDLEVKFQFAERYKKKDDKTKLIFGDGKMKGLFESSTKEFLARQDDGSFGMRLGGPFHRVRPRPLVPRKSRSKARGRRRKSGKGSSK